MTISQSLAGTNSWEKETEISIFGNQTLKEQSSESIFEKDSFFQNQGFTYLRQIQSSRIALEGRELLLNILLNSCINCKQVEKAIQIVQTLVQESQKNFFKVDEVSFNTLIKGCA